MRVSLNIGQSNRFLQVQRINQGLANRNADATRTTGRERRDTLTISPQGGRASSILEGLMQQKQAVVERKHALIGATLEKGERLDTIEVQLEHYEEQLKAIDTQISETMTQQMENMTERKPEKEDREPKTEEEIQNERMAQVSDLSVDLKQARTLSSIQVKAESAARTLESEIEMDERSSGSSFGVKIGSKASITHKEDMLVELERRTDKITAQIGEMLMETTDKLAEKDQAQVKPEDEREEAEEVSDAPDTVAEQVEAEAERDEDE